MFFVEVDSEVATSPGEAKPLLAEGTLPCDGIPCAIWSKDESKIYYWKDGRPAERNLRSGEERSIGFPTSHVVGFYSLSGDSRSFAFFGWDQHKRPGIYEYMFDGDEVVPLSTWEDGREAVRLGLGPNSALRWSPDGTKLLFQGWAGHNPGPIQVLERSGKTMRAVAFSQTRSFPRWSPDGGEIAYTDGDCLMVVPSEGGQSRSITCEPALPKDIQHRGIRAASITWSPDGSQLAWTVHNPHQRRIEIWIVDYMDGTREVLWAGEPDYKSWPRWLDWSPDREKVAFGMSYEDQEELWVLSNFLPQ